VHGKSLRDTRWFVQERGAWKNPKKMEKYEQQELFHDSDEEDKRTGKKPKKGEFLHVDLPTKHKAGKRKTRGMIVKPKGTKPFRILLEEHKLDLLPRHVPTYLTVAAAPSKHPIKMKFCCMCGMPGKYTCVRCKNSFCCRACNKSHVELKCLKFA